MFMPGFIALTYSDTNNRLNVNKDIRRIFASDAFALYCSNIIVI